MGEHVEGGKHMVHQTSGSEGEAKFKAHYVPTEDEANMQLNIKE